MSKLGKSLLNAIDDALEEGGTGITLTPSPDTAETLPEPDSKMA